MPAGRPTAYKPEYCEQIVMFFDKPHTKPTLINRITHPDGTIEEEFDKKETPNTIPFFSAFARKIGVWYDTLLTWKEKYEEFNRAWSEAKQLQKEMLIANGLNGLYNSTAYVFTAKNICGMRDQIEQVQGISGELVDLLKELNGTSRGLPQYPKQIESVITTPIIEPVKANRTRMADIIVSDTQGKGE